MIHQHYGAEPRWQAALAVCLAVALYVRLPPKIIVGPFWLLPLLVLAALVPLIILKPRRHEEAPWQRGMSIGIAAVLNAFNVATIILLALWQFSEHHKRAIPGEVLLATAVNIWVTNLIVYSLWYWEIDGGGPDARMHTSIEHEVSRSDFLFAQMTLDMESRRRVRWKPRFVDYLFLAFTNATAFSPADTFPLTRRAKFLMMAESILSVVTIVIFAARAVGMISAP